ncbi:MAG: hypothetical protein ACLTSZ_16995 [Lachnospiraceae bacterium]
MRTVFSFTKKKMAEALAVLQKVPGIEGCVLISTCNRMELWASTDDGFPEEGLYEQLCKIKEVGYRMYPPVFCIFAKSGGGAAPFWLAGGGLKSRILGEDQIVTQVGEALSFAREQYATDSVMETLFRMAVTAAKKSRQRWSFPIRTTCRAHGDRYVKGAGADLCRKEMYGHRQRCHGKADRDDAPGRRGGCHGDGTAVPEWYRRDSAWL